jgi:hypothetical protein
MFSSLLIFIFLIIIVILSILILNIKSKDKFKTNIPLHVYMTWHSKKDLFPCLKNNIKNLKKENPEFVFHLYDEEECRDFIKNNFDSIVLNSYDSLIPKAYKADLWRYCILYKKGGIYMDVKLEPINNFKLKDFINQEYLVLERPYIQKYNSISKEIKDVNNMENFLKIDNNLWEYYIGIYNAFIVMKPNNFLMKQCIDKICENVTNKEYGYGDLYPTGPGLLSNLYFSNNYKEKLNSFELFYSKNGLYILSKTGPILQHLKDYRKNQREGQILHFTELWNSKNIYTP